jgi:hypothetical protein
VRTSGPDLLAPDWTSIGPINIGGRASSLVCHPDTPDVIWLGTAAAGVWKSDDAGKSWRFLWNAQETLQVGSLAIDPLQPDTIYAGTGEVDRVAFPGAGIYRSRNGGISWTLFASARRHQIPNRIGVIAIDPFDSKHIRLGGARLSEGDSDGMHVTRDGGKTWLRENIFSPAGYSCYSIVFHPVRRGVIFASIVERGFANGIWRSIDAGKSWAQLTRARTDHEWIREVRPDDVLLFRYSALTFNGHRIHYDRRYVNEVEGYPGLVVHGPLIATLLLDLLRCELPQARLWQFAFRAAMPLFDIAPFFVCGRRNDDGDTVALWAKDNDGRLAMEATVTLA